MGWRRPTFSMLLASSSIPVMALRYRGGISISAMAISMPLSRLRFIGKMISYTWGNSSCPIPPGQYRRIFYWPNSQGPY